MQEFVLYSYSYAEILVIGSYCFLLLMDFECEDEVKTERNSA